MLLLQQCGDIVEKKMFNVVNNNMFIAIFAMSIGGGVSRWGRGLAMVPPPLGCCRRKLPGRPALGPSLVGGGAVNTKKNNMAFIFSRWPPLLLSA